MSRWFGRNLARQSRISITANFAFFLLALMVSLTEWKVVPEEWRTFYFSVKMACPLATLALTPWFIRDPYSLKANLGVAVSFIVYSMIGAVFRPLYSLAFIQAALGLAFLYAIPKNIYPVMLVLWAVLIAAAESYGLENGFWTYGAGTKSDEIMIMVSFTVVAFLVHRFFLAERIFREQTLRRFSVIGKQSALIIHDIKSLMTAPRVHLHTLERNLQGESDRELLEIVRRLDEDLDRVKDLTIELNRLSSHQLSPNDEASVLECAERGRALLGSRGRTISWSFPEPHQDQRLHLSDPRLTAVFLHLFTNAWEAFERNSIPPSRRQIFVLWEGNDLIVQDTAGGIPSQVLRLLQRKQFGSGRMEGSGLGTFLIDDTLHEIGGHARFENASGGARITLAIPKRAFVSVKTLKKS